jgi:TIR domain
MGTPQQSMFDSENDKQSQSSGDPDLPRHVPGLHVRDVTRRPVPREDGEMPVDPVGGNALEPDEVAPLMDALQDRFAEVRISAFEAVTRLPLTPGDWVKIGGFVEWVLDSSPSLPEQVAVVGAAPLIPVWSVRERVARLAGEGEGELREVAARAMAKFGGQSTLEPRTVELLLADLDDQQADQLVAAQRLAMAGASRVLDQLRRRCKMVSKDDPVRPWLAWALARSGDEIELKAFLGDVRRREADWYLEWDPRALWVLANSPLPAETVQRLALQAQTGTEFWAEQLLTALRWLSTQPPGFVTVSEMAEAKDLLLTFGILEEWPSWEAVSSVPDAMAVAWDRTFAPAAVTLLFDNAGGQLSLLGNDIVKWVQLMQGQFRPDLEGLFNVYRRRAEEVFAQYSWELENGRTAQTSFVELDVEGGPRSLCYQIGWTVSRGGLRGLVTGLAAHLTSQDRFERMAAAYLIADAANYVIQPYGPQFGGGSALGWSPAREVLVDDSADRLPERSIVDATRDGDRVECSVFAPPTVSPGSTFLIQAFAHIPSQSREAMRRAKEFDADSARRAIRTLESSVSRGTKLTFGLTMPGLRIDEPAQSLVWSGKAESVQFGVSIPRRYRLGNVVGTITVSQDWVPIGHIKFTLKVTASATANQDRSARSISVVGDDARRYEMAFVSYASEDRTIVLERVQVLPLFGVRIFVDVLDVEPGERWERGLYRHIDESDIVLLFWSSAAKRSKWVRRELRYALDRKQGDERAAPAIGPVIIEGPPVPTPWKELAYLHFNDRMIYFMEH